MSVEIGEEFISMTFEQIDAFSFGNSLLQSGYNYYSDLGIKTFELTQKVQTIFSIVNIGSLFMATCQLGQILDMHNIFLMLFPDRSPLSLISFIIIPLAILTIWGKISGSIDDLNNQSFPKEKVLDFLSKLDGTPIKNNCNIVANWHSPTSKTFNQRVHLTHMIVSVALMAFGTSPFFYAFSALSHGYSLHKISEQKWIKIDAYTTRYRGIGALTTSYIFALLPNKTKGKDCDICHKPSPTVVFHKNHVFHSICLVESLDKQNKNLASKLKIWKFINGSSISFEGIGSKKDAVSCPVGNCKNIVLHNKKELRLSDGSLAHMSLR